ncbi:acyl-CoA dehydrogenase family protein [Streptomyces sp. M2CJ-2]|uniref:Acyl-CoA dehydrogenase family protein n=1 Tax=Streptomyces cathayae TaxID=3031124 RepID=A0ABY8KDP3_9ACTN|nr:MULTISPECIES: acyl-CoA dehydrogenase family protein [unclassified Streptomyces]MBL3668104.1 acyl-CoA dehydrogenase family protein [Streptomyces sp. M2CJ-2]WGD44422.1 acyl-CoA dehydrogenase family protein [Streptomyces sp. HUAS 5]
MRRGLYTADHEEFREVVAEFVRREVAPNLERWDEQRLIDRDVWLAAGEQGLLGLAAPEEHGGAALSDYRYRNVVQEELAKVFASSLASGFSLQDDIAIPYLTSLGTEEQKKRWLPGMAAGKLIGAIAMTEPGTGSDLRGIKTSGTRVDGGWLVNGSKTFITNGIQSDVVIVVVRTDPEGGSQGFSLLVVERDMPGFTRGRKLAKVGLHAQDTAELFFDDVFVPDSHVLGTVGGGFGQLVSHLPLERLSIAAHALALADAVLADTIEYTQQRVAFGQPIADFQNTRFELAELSTELDVTRAFVDRAVLAHGEDDLTVVDAAKAKWWATEVQNRVVDRCLQLHGGYGYMLEYPVARAFQDSRIQKIFGGTNEIMKQIIGRDLIGRK